MRKHLIVLSMVILCICGCGSSSTVESDSGQVAYDNKNEKTSSTEMSEKPDEEKQISKSEIYGVYVGENGSVLELLEDGNAEYYWHEWGQVLGNNPCNVKERRVTIYLDSCECDVYADIPEVIDDNTEIVFKSDSDNWDDEKYKKVSDVQMPLDKDKCDKFIKQIYGDIISASSSEETTGVDPDLKEFLDGYEAFVDEYVEFMKNYNESGDIFGMISDYTDMLTRLSEFQEKIDGYDQNKMSSEDLKYYIDVTTRCAKKVLDVAYITE